MFEKLRKAMAMKREVKAILRLRKSNPLTNSVEYGPWEVSAKELKDELIKQGYKCATYYDRVIFYTPIF